MLSFVSMELVSLCESLLRRLASAAPTRRYLLYNRPLHPYLYHAPNSGTTTPGVKRLTIQSPSTSRSKTLAPNPAGLVLRRIYTGKFPEKHLFSNRKPMLVTTSIKDITTTSAATRVLNLLKQGVIPQSSFKGPRCGRGGEQSRVLLAGDGQSVSHHQHDDNLRGLPRGAL